VPVQETEDLPPMSLDFLQSQWRAPMSVGMSPGGVPTVLAGPGGRSGHDAGSVTIARPPSWAGTGFGSRYLRSIQRTIRLRLPSVC
jgi:hypothetical protein